MKGLVMSCTVALEAKRSPTFTFSLRSCLSPLWQSGPVALAGAKAEAEAEAGAMAVEGASGRGVESRPLVSYVKLS